MTTTTFVALNKVSGTGSSGTISFTSIPSTYTDLRIVMYATTTNTTDYEVDLRYNSDSGNNYSVTYMQGNGTSATSGRYSDTNKIRVGETSGTDNTYPTVITIDILNYSNTTSYKTCLIRYGEFQPTTSDTGAKVGLWRSTSAITRIDLLDLDGNFTNITTAALYGIRGEGISPAPKATGGAIYSDSTYYYHVFGSTGTFTPLSSLTADVLVVAGGGGAAHGGGGAGGLLGFTSQSLSATGYTCTIGAGGAGASSARTTRGTNGVDSQFGALTLVKGGGGGGQGGSGIYDGLSGGSGGGGAPSGYGIGAGGAASPSGQGNAGGGAGAVSMFYAGGGGGGASAAGATGNSTNGTGAGGNGSSAYSSWLSAIGVGQNVNGTYYIAGGGGGGSDNGAGVGGYGGANGAIYAGSNAVASTGGGGGGSSNTSGGNGGSGVVIVRYAK